MSNNRPPIVVAVDGSDESRRAFELAVEEAAAHGTTLQVVHVVDISPAVLHLPDDKQVNTAEIAEEKHQEVWTAVGDIDASNVTAEFVGLSGTPSGELSEYCSEVGARLLVVGNRGRGRIKGFLGSTSKRLLEHAPCPVLVVK